ncbi:MAG: hypothetical protein Q9170_004009 [Blastenia crenularia]
MVYTKNEDCPGLEKVYSEDLFTRKAHVKMAGHDDDDDDQNNKEKVKRFLAVMDSLFANAEAEAEPVEEDPGLDWSKMGDEDGLWVYEEDEGGNYVRDQDGKFVHIDDVDTRS